MMDERPVQSCDRPSWWRVLTIPLLRFVNPDKVAACMLAASRLQFVVTFVVYSLLLGVAIMTPFAVEEVLVHGNSFAGFWYESNSIAPVPMWLMIGCLIVMPLLNCVTAWLFLPVVHQVDSVMKSFRRAFRATGSSMGWINIFIFSIGLIWIAARAIIDDSDIRQLLLNIGYLVAIRILIWWLSRAAQIARGPLMEISIPPRCEGCGYDLTHMQINQRCPECGMEIARSLDADKRSGIAWSHTRSVGSWLNVNWQIVRRPHSIYENIKIRTEDDGVNKFAGWNYVAIGVAAAIWMAFMVGTKERRAVLIAVPIMFSIFVPLVGWLLLRLIGACVITGWIIKRSLSDFRCSPKVLAYESAWLWVFCAFNGLFITSIVAADSPWMSNLAAKLLGHPLWILGLEPEVCFVLIGNAALTLWWVLRYRVILRAIRWSNF